MAEESLQSQRSFALSLSAGRCSYAKDAKHSMKTLQTIFERLAEQGTWSVSWGAFGWFPGAEARRHFASKVSGVHVSRQGIHPAGEMGRVWWNKQRPWCPKYFGQRRVRRLDTHSISLYKINLVDRFGVAFTFARSVFVYGDAHKGPLRVIRRDSSVWKHLNGGA